MIFDLILQNSKEQNGKFWNLKINFCEVIIKVKIHSTHTYWFFHHDSSSKRNELHDYCCFCCCCCCYCWYFRFSWNWFHEKNVDFIDFFLLIFWGCCCYSCCCCLLLVWFDFDLFFFWLFARIWLILILIFQPN